MTAPELVPTPDVHPVPGGFIVVTPADGRFVVESFVRSVDITTGGMTSSPFLHFTVDAGQVAAEVDEQKRDIAEHVKHAVRDIAHGSDILPTSV